MSSGGLGVEKVEQWRWPGTGDYIKAWQPGHGWLRPVSPVGPGLGGEPRWRGRLPTAASSLGSPLGCTRAPGARGGQVVEEAAR